MLGFSIGQRVVSWILEKALGKYIEDIDSNIKDFQYGLRGGNLVLHNLNLKAEALVGLDLPIEVKAGHIGLLELHLPAITNIYSESVVVKIDNVFLLSSPVCDRLYDEVKDEAMKKARKRETLEKLEQLLKQEQSEKGEKDAITDPGFLETIKITVLQNIEVQITNIHIRYEDDVTNQNTPFAFGITLQELSLNRSTVPQTLQNVNKLLSLKELSIYWNCLLNKQQLLKNKLDDGDWKSEMSNSIDSMEFYGAKFDYLVEPINGNADLTINIENQSQQPVVSCTGCFEHININFKRHMFLNAVILKDSFAMMRINEKYRKYHPGVPCKGNAKLWWRYSCDSVIGEVVKPKRQFWNKIWEYRSAYKDYRTLYTDKLLNPKTPNVAKLDEYEMELNIESIVMARKEAEKTYLTMEPSMAVVKPANQGVLSRLSNWWYGDSESAEAVVIHAKHPSASNDDWWKGLSDSETKELHEAFHYNKDQPLADSADTTYVKYKLDVKLEGVQLNLLIDAVIKPIHVASLYIRDITGLMAVRLQGLKFTSSIKYLEAFNSMDPGNRVYLAEVDSTTPETCGGSESDESSFFSVIVEQYPIDIQADVSIKVNTLPVRLMYDHNIVCAVMAFFYVPLERFNIGAQLRSLTPEFSTAGLQYAIDNHQRVYVEATICSPYLIIPAKGITSKRGSKLIVDLGVLKVSTELRPKNQRLENNSLEDREAIIYDKYTLDVQNVKVMYTSSDDDWKKARRLTDSDIHLMPSINLVTTISLSAEPDFNKLPKFKVDSKLKLLQIKVSDSLIESLLTTVFNFPHPSAQQFFDKYKLRRSGVVNSGYRHGSVDEPDNALAPASNLMRSELNSDWNSVLNEVDFERLQRLEDKDIFVTQGDLLNLWFLLSKEKNKKSRARNVGEDHVDGLNTVTDGLNAVADLLLQPEEVVGNEEETVRLQDFNSSEVNEVSNDVFVLAREVPPPSNLELPGLNGYTGAEFYTLIHVKFNIEEVSLKLLSGYHDYLSVVVRGVTGMACRTNCGVSVCVKMKTFYILDDLHLDTNRATLRIAYSPKSLSMASFEGRFIDDVTKISFTRVSNAILVNIATIQLCISDESTKKIVQIVTKVSRLLTILQRTNEPHSSGTIAHSDAALDNSSVVSEHTASADNDIFYDAVSKLDTASLLSRLSIESLTSRRRSSRTRSSRTGKKKSKEPPVDVIDCSVKCSLNTLKIDLQRGFNVIAQLDVSAVSCEYELKKTHWSVDGKLGALSLRDPMASIYQQVLVVEEDLKEVMTFHFKSYNQSVAKNESCDQHVNVELRRMRLVYINKFVSRLANFFGEFSTPTAVERIRETSRNKISSTAKSAHSKGTRTRITVEAKTPLITVPESDVSHNALLLKLGDLHISNEFSTEPVNSTTITTTQSYDQMTITLKNIAIESIRHLLTPITTSLMVKRALSPIHTTSVDFNVETHIDQFTVEASQLDLQMLGQVLYENVMVKDEQPQSYDVTDVGSTISSAFSSTGSSSSSGAKALHIALCLSGVTLHLKHEDPTTSVLTNVSESFALMNVAELKVDFCKGKKDDSMSCVVTLRNFAIEDQLSTCHQEFNTNSVIELEGQTNQILLIKYNVDTFGDSTLFCSVEQMRFNVNMPFVKSLLTFVQDSFTTWKPPEPPRNITRLSRDRHAGTRRRRKINTAVINRRASQLTPIRRISPAGLESATRSNPRNTKMKICMEFGKQSVYVITGDGSLKALVAELNVAGEAVIASAGKLAFDITLTDVTVYSTSLRSEESHLKHQCLLPCNAYLKYKSDSPLPEMQDQIPPKVEVEVKLTKIDITLSTNLIYHAFDALALLKGEDNPDDVSTARPQTNVVDLDKPKELNRDQWLEQYDKEEEYKHVEMNPMKAALESLVLKEFGLDLEFSVAVGREFVPILRTRSTLSASVKDWSNRLRAECCFTLDSNYYNETLGAWEPLLEPMFDQKTGKYRRWEVLARLNTAPSHPMAKTDPSEILVDSQELDTFIHHQMSSAKEKQRESQPDPPPVPQQDNRGRRVQIDAPLHDAPDAASIISSEDGNDIFLASAGGVHQHINRTMGLKGKAGLMSSRSAPTGYRGDAILEEEEADPGDKTPMLQSSTSAPVPSLYVTQPSHEEQRADNLDTIDDVDGPSNCQSLDSRLDECDAKINDKGVDPEVMCTYISLLSRDKLLLNVSPQGLNVVTSVVDTFTKKPNDSTLFEILKSNPLTITNLLGIDTCVSLHPSTKDLDIKLEQVRITENIELSECTTTSTRQHGNDSSDEQSSDSPVKGLVALTSSASIKVKDRTELSKKAGNALTKQQLRLAVDGYLPISDNISYRRTQSQDFNATARIKRNESLCLRVRTQSKHGRRHVYIYSQLKIRNELQHLVQVSYQELSFDANDNRHVPTNKSIGTISPGEMLNVPALVAQQKKLLIRPVRAESSETGENASSAEEFGESNEALWWRDHLKSKSGPRLTTTKRSNGAVSEFLTCVNNLQQTFTFKAIWIPRKCTADRCPGNCPSFDVLLQPTAEIKNFLPFPIRLDVQVKTTVGSLPTIYLLQPGETNQINDSTTSPKHCFLIVPEYQNVMWKGSLDIHDKMSENRVTSIVLHSEVDSATAQGSMTLEPKPFTNHPVTIFCHVSRAHSNRGSKGQLQLSFYSTYWISNTTGICLHLKSSGIGSDDEVETSQSYPIIFSTGAMEKKMQLRVPGYKWSKSFAVGAAGTVGSVGCLDDSSRSKYRFMVETTLSNTQLTKIITIFPMFVVVNKLEHTLMYSESGNARTTTDSPGSPVQVNTTVEDSVELIPADRIQTSTIWTSIQPEEAKAFWPTRRGKSLSLVVKKEEVEDKSPSIPANKTQKTILLLSGQSYVTADVSGGLGSAYFITLRPYQLGDALVRIENLTSHSLLFSQGYKSNRSSKVVASSTSFLYFWPNPMAERKLYWSIPELKMKPVLATTTQDLNDVIKHNGLSIYWQCYGDDLQRVLTFSDHEKIYQILNKKNQKEQATLFMFSALESVCVSLINMHCLEIAILSVNQSPSKWQVKVDGQSKWLPLGEKLSNLLETSYCESSEEMFEREHDGVHLQIDLGTLKFLQPIAGQLRRESYPGIRAQYQSSEFTMTARASVNHFQIDNQLPDAFFPVVFHPTSEAYVDKVKTKTKPCMAVFLRRRFPLDGSTDTYKKLDVQIEQFALKIDKGFILTLLDFVSVCRQSGKADHSELMRSNHEEDINYCLRDLAADTKHKTDKMTGAKIYVEHLHISNILVKLSFSMAGNAHLTDVESTQSSFGGDVVDFLLRSIGMTLTEVSDIDFRDQAEALHVHRLEDLPTDLLESIKGKLFQFKFERPVPLTLPCLSQFAVTCSVVTTDQLNSDILTFYKSQAIRQGYVFVLGLDIIGNPLGLVKDVQRGLKDFFSSADPLSFSDSKTLMLGFRSAYGNIVGGLCLAGSKITESLGRGVNVLTFDRTFQKSRLRRMKSQPSNFAASLLLSGKTMGLAVGSGVAGIVLQPKRGVEKNGAAGFLKGIGKGLTGVLVKPVGGVFDSVSVVLDGFRRVAQSDTQIVERSRLPRPSVPSEGFARYHPYLAEGMNILNTMCSYKYSPDDVYWAHLELKRKDKHLHIALATTKSLYLLYAGRFGTNLRTHWCVPLEDLHKPTYSDGVIVIRRISRATEEEKLLESDNRDDLKWFHKRLTTLLKYIKATYRS